jgi:predicted transcriptional regulator
VAGRSPVDIVEGIIRSRKIGVDVTELKYNTNLDVKEIRAIIAKLKKEGRIKSPDRGFYIIA